jgi:hypothetical protein
MDRNGDHHVTRIDDIAAGATLHERAEAVAIPDFNYLEQTFEGIAIALTRPRGHAEHDEADPTG